MRSDLFKKIECEIEDLNDKELIELTVDIILRLNKTLNDNTIFMTTIMMCMGLGFNNSGKLRIEQEIMLESVSELISDSDKTLPLLKKALQEGDIEKYFKLLNVMLKQAPFCGMDFLKLILCFANVDYIKNEEILNRLDPVFEMVLTVDSLN